MRAWMILCPLALLACKDERDSADTAASVPLPPQIALREEGWLRGDLHNHTTHSDGFDDVATVIALAEYLRDPAFLAYHPEYADNQLDFLALSDHRTVSQNSDPDFASDELVMVPSEEFGSTGHANTPGVSELVDHDPGDDGVSLEDIQAGIEHAHAQGALFSPNHPFLPDIPFPWDANGFDTIEIWNCGWALASPAISEDDLKSWQASHGAASAAYRRAAQTQGMLASAQGLSWYEAMLSRGEHVGLVGGSDRHAVILPGFPTTYVRVQSADLQGLLDGMAARHSFVTRTPASAQLLASLTVGDQVYELGDQVPLPAGGAEVSLELQVARAEGGLLRVVAGGAVESDEALQSAALGSVLAEESVSEVEHLLSHSWTAQPGDWFYPLLLEPLLAPGLSEAQQQTVLEAAQAASASGEDVVMIATVVAPLLDSEVLGNAEDCDPEDWIPDMMQCSPADADGMASFFIPDMLDRAMNAWVEDDALTDWAMGAVGSAVLFVEE